MNAKAFLGVLFTFLGGFILRTGMTAPFHEWVGVSLGSILSAAGYFLVMFNAR